MIFTFQLTGVQAFNPLFSYIISILDIIFTSQKLYIKSLLEKNEDIFVFHEVIIQDVKDLFTQKLLLNDEHTSGFGVENIDKEIPLKTFGPKDFITLFEDNCKIYQMYKRG